MLDEATANVDLATDGLLQAAIRRDFEHVTILTIAHRLVTVIDYDRVLVMDAGVAREFDRPAVLLSDASSLLSSLVDETGPAQAAHLRTLAVARMPQ